MSAAFEEPRKQLNDQLVAALANRAQVDEEIIAVRRTLNGIDMAIAELEKEAKPEVSEPLDIT